MRIAVDISALATPGNGIARYLSELLHEMLPAPACQPADGELDNQWFLYGRRAVVDGIIASRSARIRRDGLPTHLGRLLSLATSQPAWATRDQPDVFWGPAHRLPLWLPASTACVVTIHDLCWIRAPDSMRRSGRMLDAALMPRALRVAHRIIAVSDSTARDLVQNFPDCASRIRVVHEAARAPEPMDAAAPSLLLPPSPYVLFVGTLEPRKNLIRLMEAFAAVIRDREQPPSLVIVGAHGWGGVSPLEVSERLGIRQHVRLLGPVADGELDALYRGARCLALPSVYEGFGLTALEALARGTPVLGGNSSSLPEVVGNAGLLVDPLDCTDIARGLNRLLFDDAGHRELASNAVAQADKFSWQLAGAQTLAVFIEAFNSARQPAS